MDWRDEARHLESYSGLSEREAQVITLSNKGHSVPEIKDILKQDLDVDVSKSSLRSSKSSAQQKLVKSTAAFGYRFGGHDHAQVPARPQPLTDGDTTTLYIGDIGTGKTTTGQTHALRLAANDRLGSTLIVDPLREQPWMTVADELSDSVYVSPQGSKSGIEPDEFAETIHSEAATLAETSEDRLTIFIDQAHWVLNNPNDLISTLLDVDTTVDLRLLTQAFTITEERTQPDLLYVHGIDQDALSNYIEQTQIAGASTLQPNYSTVPRRLEHTLDYSEVLTYNPETGEGLVRPHILAQSEKTTLGIE